MSIFLEKRKIRPKVTVRFGKLIRASEFEFSQQYRPGEIRAAAEKIMDEITALWKAGHAEK